MSHISPELPSAATLLDTAIQGEPLDLAVGYGHLALKNSRQDIVANRIALNIGPLFGIPNPDGPFGTMSWLCNYQAVTLTEIARGAPELSREERKSQPSNSADDVQNNRGWQRVGRAIVGKTPNQIISATTNSFGPSAKYGTMLTGINRLLEPHTQLLGEAVKSTSFQDLAPEDKLRAYGTMLFGVYRPQPLLIHAGFHARALQRAAQHIPFDIANSLKDTTFARRELPSVQQDPHKTLVFDLEIVDMTVAGFARTLNWKRPQFTAQSSTLVADGVYYAVKQAGNGSFTYFDDPSTEQRTMQSTAEPSIMGDILVQEVVPYLYDPPSAP